MNSKVCLLLLQLLALGFATSQFRYNNRAINTQEAIRHRKQIHPKELRREQECSQFGICEHDPNYRENEVRRLVDNHRSVHSFLKGSVIEPVNGISINNRHGQKEQSFCKTVDVVAAPRLMMDVDNIRRHIVNLQNYSQILKYQTCNHENGEECFKETLLDMKTKCMQKFNNIKLVTVDVDHGVLEYRTFRIPSTCVCTYMRDFS